MREWQMDDAALGRVRAGVMGRVRRRRMARRAGAAAVAAALLAGVFLTREPEMERLSLAMPAGPAAPVVMKTRVPLERPAARPAMARGAEKITLFTADPDVVIVLVTEGAGE